MGQKLSARLSVVSAGMVWLSIALAAGVPSAQILPLQLVSTAWSPFTNAPGHPRFASDLVDAALERVGIKTKTAIVEPAAFTPALLTGPYDGSAAAWHDAEREQVVLYSQAYLENRLVLVGRKGADVSATSWSALKGKKVAIVGGYAYGDIEGAGPTFVKTKGEEDSLTQLLHAQVDYTLMDQLVVEYLQENYAKEADSRLQVGSTPLLKRPLYFVIRRSRPDADSIISRFNAQLKAMILDHTYHKLLHVDWISADLDGSGVPVSVPASNYLGTTPPQHVYSLVAPPIPLTPGNTGSGFYIGGTIYPDWASVPDRYKAVDPQHPDSQRSTASIFKFVW